MSSIGEPSASTILPRKPSPTGTPAIFPVRTTLLPSLTSISLPKRITPTSSRLTGKTAIATDTIITRRVKALSVYMSLLDRKLLQ